MNTNAKPTPGPWHFFNSGAGLIRSENGKTIAQLKSVSRQGFRKAADLDEEVANARLIAAGPTMLEALKRLCDSLAWEENRSGTTYSGYESAKAAIAQAEGNAQ